DWVAQAQSTNTWLIFVYHGVDANTTTSVDGDIYDVTPTQLTAEVAAIQASGVTVETLGKALASVDAQMGITPTNMSTTSTVTFNANGGTGTMANETAGAATPLTANKYTRTGYTFSGWNTLATGKGTAYANDAVYSFTSSTTLYAQWKKS
ncbi:MAG TPA: InlB B-repeat-containing protein, partial [Candidatus Binatia bacterium]|nr:InlB B-repeat-containing protein [Candidatus Binatia bacterium]